MLQSLKLRPGINKETTSYANEGGWVDGDKIRFRQGYPESIGGWEKRSHLSFIGSCRALIPWTTLALERFIGVGTHLKYFIDEGGQFYDVTPIRETTSAGAITFAATAGSALVTVTDTSHGARAGDFVTFYNAVSLGGNITAAVLNQEYRIETVVDANTYTIQARTGDTPLGNYYADGDVDYSSAAVLATAADVGSGGGSQYAAYQINVGLDTSVFGNGWGAGGFSRGSWGSGADLTILSETLRLWQHDTFGEDLIINVRGGGVYYWDATTGLNARAIPLTALSGASNAPIVANKVIVSDVDRHVIAFGANPLGSSVQDALLIRFSSQEDAADWTPTTTNTAGDLKIGSGSEIVTAVETRQQILVFTDASLHGMQYIGPPYTFGINMLSEHITIQSPNAAVAVEDSVFWMGKNEFYMYRGSVQKLECSLKEFIFSDLNTDQTEKIFAAINSAFSEIWWFYPSKDSNNIDSYVVYNYEQNIWYNGSMVRTAWIDRGVTSLPIASCNCGHLYYHEYGLDDGSQNPPVALNSYIESSPIDIGDGEQFSFVRRIIPDLSFRNSTANSPAVLMALKAYNYNGGGITDTDSDSVIKTSSMPIGQYTQKLDLRIRGRAMSLRVEANTVGTAWRLGNPRIDIRTDGKR